MGATATEEGCRARWTWEGPVGGSGNLGVAGWSGGTGPVDGAWRNRVAVGGEADSRWGQRRVGFCVQSAGAYSVMKLNEKCPNLL